MADATNIPVSSPEDRTDAGFWPQGWWKLLDWKIGIIPIPIYLILIALIVAFIVVGKGKIGADILTSIAVLAVGGFTCGEIGRNLPVIKHLGAAAIFATFLPSYLVYAHLLPAPLIEATRTFYAESNFLYLYIACIIVGSILGMSRERLISGAVKIFIPLVCGLVAAACAGTLLGTLLGLGTYHTFFYVVVPMMGGGVGEGVIPISIGYALIKGGDQGVILAQILPMVMMGGFTAIVFSSVLNFLGKREPRLTGNGHITPEPTEGTDLAAVFTGSVDAATIAAAGMTAVAFYLIGLLAQKLFDFPAPVSMIFIAFLMKLINAISPQLQHGGQVIQRFFAIAVTYPLLFAVGVAITPWDKLIGAFTVLNVVVIVFSVAVLMGVGFLVGRAIKMYPIDVAIVCSCSAAQGGTGDVAILTASERLTLLPFCSIATRVGGATMVTVALILMRLLG